jgi:hypothetical protein
MLLLKCSSITAGSQICGAGFSRPLNPGGATPMIVQTSGLTYAGRSSTVFPTRAGSELNTVCQQEWLMTATGFCPEVWSSSDEKVRPNTGVAPSVEKKFAETSWTGANRVLSPICIGAETGAYASSSEKTRLCS